MANIKILVAAHKPYWMPNDDVYMPIHVGKEGKADIGYIGDNTGDHISHKNPNYCELTALYWAWKNLEVDYIGVVHYRRYFSQHYSFFTKKRKFNDIVLSKKEIDRLMNDYDIILPKKRRYYIETVREQYCHAHISTHLDLVESIILNTCPEYKDSFFKVMNSKSLYLYNMFIMSKSNFDRYCDWLFSILFSLEKKIKLNELDDYQSRVMGFLAERLFNVWLLQNKYRYKCQEISVVNLESINWCKKIFDFVMRKYRNESNK